MRQANSQTPGKTREREREILEKEHGPFGFGERPRLFVGRVSREKPYKPTKPWYARVPKMDNQRPMANVFSPRRCVHVNACLYVNTYLSLYISIYTHMYKHSIPLHFLNDPFAVALSWERKLHNSNKLLSEFLLRVAFAATFSSCNPQAALSDLCLGALPANTYGSSLHAPFSKPPVHNKDFRDLLAKRKRAGQH